MGLLRPKAPIFLATVQSPEVMKMSTDTCDVQKTERLSPGAADDWWRVEEVGHSLPVGVSLQYLTRGWKVQMVIKRVFRKQSSAVCFLSDSSRVNEGSRHWWFKWRRNYYWQTMGSSARWVNWPIKLLPFNCEFKRIFSLKQSSGFRRETWKLLHPDAKLGACWLRL